jgi:hypothetical protein
MDGCGDWMELDRAIARVSQNTHLMLFCPRHRDAAYSAVRTVQYITHRSHCWTDPHRTNIIIIWSLPPVHSTRPAIEGIKVAQHCHSPRQALVP